MTARQELPPEIKGEPVFASEYDAEIVGCNLHPDGQLFEHILGDDPYSGVITWCRPPNERAHIIIGRSITGRMSNEELLANAWGEPKHPGQR